MTSAPGTGRRHRDGTPRLARSFAEANLYIELQACEVCGQVALKQQPGVTNGQLDGAPVVWLDAVCANCGARERFVFRMPAQPTVSAPGHIDFGGAQPSELIDPGQWLKLADALASDLPQPDELAAHRGSDLRDRVDLAAAAVTEALKFVKPGADRVPGYEFWTDSGRQMLDGARWRFTRESLEFELDRYRRALAALDGG